MSSPSFVLAEVLLQKEVPHSARYGGKVLTLLTLFSGLVIALFLCACRIGRSGQDQIVNESSITMANHFRLLPTAAKQLPSIPTSSKRFQSLTIAASAQSQESETLKPNPGLKGASAVVTPLLKPFYSVEAPLQAAVTGAVGKIDPEEVRAEIDQTIASSPCVVYSYPLSPFCGEAVKLLESTGCTFSLEEPGQEWFLLGPKGSAIRNELGQMTGQTSFPHVFIGGQSVGGLFSGGPGGGGIAGLAESGELLTMLQKAGACMAPKKKGGWPFR